MCKLGLCAKVNPKKDLDIFLSGSGVVYSYVYQRDRLPVLLLGRSTAQATENLQIDGVRRLALVYHAYNSTITSI